MIMISTITNYCYKTPSHNMNHISNYINQGYWEITGSIVAPPEYISHKTRLIIRVSRLKNKTRDHCVSGKIRLSVRDDVSHYQQGWRIRFVSRIYPFSNFNNPGRFDYKKYMNYHQNIYGNVYIKKNQIEILDQLPEMSMIQKTIQHVQITVSQLLEKNTSSQASGFLHAISLGNRHFLDENIKEIFISTGVSHLMAISGLHMGMIAMTSFLLFRWLFRRSKIMCLYGWSDCCAAIPSFIMLAYFVISGMSPSAQRA
ncbi:MAG: hypothetical protein OMM_13880, partial [Candidatus Magnetoglobus multicellularis str. Araruama]